MVVLLPSADADDVSYLSDVQAKAIRAFCMTENAHGRLLPRSLRLYVAVIEFASVNEM